MCLRIVGNWFLSFSTAYTELIAVSKQVKNNCYYRHLLRSPWSQQKSKETKNCDVRGGHYSFNSYGSFSPSRRKRIRQTGSLYLSLTLSQLTLGHPKQKIPWMKDGCMTNFDTVISSSPRSKIENSLSKQPFMSALPWQFEWFCWVETII